MFPFNARVFLPALPIAALVSAGAAVLSASTGVAQGSRPEIVIVIDRVRALDNIDPNGRPADFYAKLTINGVPQQTETVRDQNDIRPNWRIVQPVDHGTHNVKLELWDWDHAVHDQIDINPTGQPKRDLDFTVNTTRCTIGELRGGNVCGSSITREGNERKRASITFRVFVERR